MGIKKGEKRTWDIDIKKEITRDKTINIRVTELEKEKIKNASDDSKMSYREMLLIASEKRFLNTHKDELKKIAKIERKIERTLLNEPENEKKIKKLSFLKDKFMKEIEKKEEEMKNKYDAVEIVDLGYSDIARLTMHFCSIDGDYDNPCKILNMGSDGFYNAYILINSNEIPKHYKLVISGETWLKIFDDNSLVYNQRADKIEVYRSGDFGIMINLVYNDDLA